MERHLSPKQVARALGVSEASVKRWCDRGLIPVVRTAGGHRRIALDVFLRFLRSSEHRLARPEVIGLPATTGQGERTISRARTQFREALEAGDEEVSRQIIFDLFLAENPLSAICDLVIAEAFHDIGDRWDCGDIEIYQERRGCEICTRVVHQLSLAVSRPEGDAPLALGGTVDGDHYSLPTTMVEMVLREIGWRAMSLGACLPLATLAAAVRENRPRLFWLSVSHLVDEAKFIKDYAAFYDQVAGQTAVVVGGRALHQRMREQMKFSAHCDNLQHLEGFAKTLLPQSS